MMKINNVPEYAKNYEYVVFNVVDGENWFWGAYSDINQASYAANEIHGQFAPTKDVELM